MVNSAFDGFFSISVMLDLDRPDKDVNVVRQDGIRLKMVRRQPYEINRTNKY